MVFEETFPDRSILVGEMAVRMVFVAIYGGFIEGVNRYFRPSTVIRFNHLQANESTEAARFSWVSMCHTPGYKLEQQWYADNTREPLRDDLIRNRAIPYRVVLKREGVATTSPAPIYCLAKSFTALFNPELSGQSLSDAITQWQEDNLAETVLQRMRLRRLTGMTEGQVTVTTPTHGMTLRLSPGEASIITRDACQELLPRILIEPVVVHISTSDKKKFPELAELANSIGLDLPTSAELPDIVAADTGHPDNKLRFVFIEVVHTDGPITELRKEALLQISDKLGSPREHVQLITAFEDRNASPFKKRISELATNSIVWFRSEPNLLMRIELLKNTQKKPV
jgi:hypothetical protein